MSELYSAQRQSVVKTEGGEGLGRQGGGSRGKITGKRRKGRGDTKKEEQDREERRKG